MFKKYKIHPRGGRPDADDWTVLRQLDAQETLHLARENASNANGSA
jgi:hypothetical protein